MSHAVANQSTDGGTFRQPQFKHPLAGDLRPLLCRKLRHVGIGGHEEPHVLHIHVEHHLVNITGSQGFLIDDGSNIEAFGHLHIVEVLHHGYRLANPQSFGGQASEDIRLGIAGECHESL